MMMLDPKSVQVLFADLQPQMVARSKTNPPEALARSVAVLAQVARLLHLPMHLSVVPEGGQPPELIPELARETEGVAQLPRISFSPFFDEATRAAIAATGRQHLVIAGFATEVVVLHAVRDALAAGYRDVDRREGVPLDARRPAQPGAQQGWAATPASVPRAQGPNPPEAGPSLRRLRC